MEFKLDVKDAKVTVKPDGNHWRWSFTHPDGSCGPGDSDWCPTERGAKSEAVDHYRLRKSKWGRNSYPRARWIRTKIPGGQ